MAEIPEASGNITVFTDNTEPYLSDAHHITACDISPMIDDMTNSGDYFYRAKPCLLLHALREFKCPCVLLDTDTFVRRGFARALRRHLRRGAVMDKYLRRNPYPDCHGFETILPSGQIYRYDKNTAAMYNSGVIGVQPEHASAIANSIAIVDAIRPFTKPAGDQEQFAINEALRLHGIEIGVMQGVLKHYCAVSQKRYMNWRFEKDAALCPVPIVPGRPRITVNKPIAWCFKRLSNYPLS